MSRDDSDGAYVVGLCNKVLDEPALRQHKFDWLLGDRHECQAGQTASDQPVPHFGKRTNSPSAAYTGISVPGQSSSAIGVEVRRSDHHESQSAPWNLNVTAGVGHSLLFSAACAVKTSDL
ncbi:hypothetical protein [Streptomyces sp. NPDC058671]|uniref:hypothetical protein n=1 Tax=Streptomyces sp. NPDC058671 TaxID=3346590 RepID=UPI0036486C5E